MSLIQELSYTFCGGVIVLEVCAFLFTFSNKNASVIYKAIIENAKKKEKK